MTLLSLFSSFLALVVFVVVLGRILLWVSTSTRWQVCGELVWRVSTAKRLVALTFDDGPTPEHVDEILQTLQRRGARATFFLTGEGIARHRDEAAKILAAGHEIGNHSYSHRRMTLRSNEFIRKEIETTDSLIRELGPQDEILFRPPFGKKLLLLPLYLTRNHRRTIMWSLEADKDPSDGRDSGSIARHAVDNVQPGSILLFHVFAQSREPERVALPTVLERLADAGYRCVSVSELLASAASRDTGA